MIEPDVAGLIFEEAMEPICWASLGSEQQVPSTCKLALPSLEYILGMPPWLVVKGIHQFT